MAALALSASVMPATIFRPSAIAAMSKIKAVKHALTSKKEVNAAFNAKIKKLGLFYDNVLKN
ncbi:hypothetical protein NE463_20840, partial [Anaerotruncus colihominis]|nr:hypothetical protein [Anaerotruncus colihominis]